MKSFLTLFLMDLPFEIVVRVWDYILSIGIRGLIDVMLVAISLFSKEILE
jgi:hypothetical protein